MTFMSTDIFTREIFEYIPGSSLLLTFSVTTLITVGLIFGEKGRPSKPEIPTIITKCVYWVLTGIFGLFGYLFAAYIPTK